MIYGDVPVQSQHTEAAGATEATTSLSVVKHSLVLVYVYLSNMSNKVQFLNKYTKAYNRLL